MALAAIGLGLQALGMGMDVAQMIGAKKAQREAQIKMDKSIEEAKRLVQINRAEQLQIPLEKYERQLDEQARTAKTALGALGEADPRLLAAGVGRIGEGVRRGTEAITEDMSQELAGRQEKIIAGQQAIDEALANISLAEASGDAQAIADARKQYNVALAGISSAAQSGLKTFMEDQELYQDSSKKEARKARKALRKLKTQDEPLDKSLFVKDPMDASVFGTYGTELG